MNVSLSPVSSPIVFPASLPSGAAAKPAPSQSAEKSQKNLGLQQATEANTQATALAGQVAALLAKAQAGDASAAQTLQSLFQAVTALSETAQSSSASTEVGQLAAQASYAAQSAKSGFQPGAVPLSASPPKLDVQA